MGDNMETRFLPLLLVVFLAMIVPFVLARFRRIPVVVGEIAAGIIIGPSVLGWLHGDEATLQLLSEIGFAFLMFLSGLEIDFSLLFASAPRGKKNGTNPLWLALGSFAITLVLSALIGFGLVGLDFVRDPWMMTLILSTTSLGIVVPVLKERQISTTGYGQILLLTSLLADFLTMFMITVYVAVRSTGLSFEILLIGVLFIPVVLLYQLGVRHLRRPSIRRLVEELAGATSQIKVRGAFALMVAFVVLAELLGAELILGAFLAGVVASMLSGPQDESLRHKLDAIGFGFFVPLFFVFVGIQFDLTAVLTNPSAWLLLPVLFVAAFAVKLIASLVFRLSYSWRETLAGGTLLSARLSLIIAASAIGLRMGVISEAVNADIILIAALTATFAPLFFNLLLSEIPVKHQTQMLVYGTTDLAFQVARDLNAHGENVCFIETDPREAQRIREMELPVSHASGGVADCLNGLPATQVNAFLALNDDPEPNLEACRAARSRDIQHILAFVSDPIRLPDFHVLGVQTLTPSLHRSSLLALMARNPAIFSLLTSTEDERDLRELTMLNRDADGKRLIDLQFPPGLLVLAIRRGDELIVPHGTTRLSLGDRVTILGEHDALQAMQDRLGA
jgi:Kef-type K+ transport system membrane component KefB/Trk K+ transport system NAD-binding subunit